jgi:hypothetical protein
MKAKPLALKSGNVIAAQHKLWPCSINCRRQSRRQRGQKTFRFPAAVCHTSHPKETVRIRFSAEGAAARNRQENRMTRKQLEEQRECVEAQLRWALLHGGDQELLDLLRVESDRLVAMMENCPAQETAAA